MSSPPTFKRIGLLTSLWLGTFLPADSGAQSLCIRLTNASGVERSMPVAAGTILRLRFRHSIYGSPVEERFALQRDGFQLIQLRYGEARLVDFYGHEKAELEDGDWVINPTPRIFPSLHFNVSTDKSMALLFDHHDDYKPIMIRPTGALRLTVVSCKSGAHG